jgi:hypothetical protein
MFNEFFNMMLQGQGLRAVNSLMESKMGYMWYVMILTAPVVMVYIKTESMSFAATILFWNIALWGGMLFPDGWTNALFTVFILLGFGTLVFKVFSPVK